MLFTAINNKQDRLPAGDEGQVWTAGSDGTGSWQNPSGGEWVYASAFSDVIVASKSGNSYIITVSKDFQVMFSDGNYGLSTWLDISAGTYSSGTMIFVEVGTNYVFGKRMYFSANATTLAISLTYDGNTFATAPLTYSAICKGNTKGACIRYKA